MNWVDLLAIGLATAGIADTWLNGDIFADARAKIDDWHGLTGQLLRCDFCLSRQLPFWLILFCYVPSLILYDRLYPTWVVTAVKMPIYFFAAGEIAWSINLLRGESRGFMRTQIKIQSADEHKPDERTTTTTTAD